jgi:hypothetical protein
MASIPDDEFDVVIENTGSIERFRAQIRVLTALLG